MNKLIHFACFILIAIILVSGTIYVKQLMVQASETKEQDLKQVKETQTQKENLKSRITLAEEFTVLKEHKTEKKPLNKKFTGIIPTNVTIPSIDVNASIEQVGLLETGQMAAPSTEDGVAWFEPGSKPGTKGNAVLAGHVDSKSGPAIFYHLKDLEKGDEITIKDKQGTTLTFVVKKKQSYPRDKAPLNEIFGYSKGRHLNLITCTGTFDRSKGTHQERLVVYTELKAEEAMQLEDEAKLPVTPTNVKISGNLLTWHAVREGNIIGYRIYKKVPGGTFTHIGSISEYERKSYVDKNSSNAHYYVTAVDEYGQESAPSSMAK
ncbi:class F sortase [Peribacillus muralis]|uniref:class F sortase n=1 Tax=Peribacillus muralis TaxID=264697 RepID=UPI001F4D67DA|nr:class F sortase [Peribacillus muralis]MCK1994665.1 class F sortase [Peribacillus muralis]MCK2015100.1 class F sortase [Peribacillus muralis]